ncbi:aldehyde dehydrogenase family protein [Nguyenibacter vanlangensis]|uniref:Aldehyde dehydrogenase family protein n=1 Tax=Nguyenibacter vanlangensis TaxID=1216886 RepID=A0A7Y7M3S5_9PROT|nr:aldehyde dehydrogenase family protein [Nguyenibacter vanlangensis]NVN10000.1 aldehyde dehydrogenase family protein [Nguyenibacter vanlangensis]
MPYAGASNVKQVWLETGGKSLCLVFPDADLDAAARQRRWRTDVRSASWLSISSRPAGCFVRASHKGPVGRPFIPDRDRS